MSDTTTDHCEFTRNADADGWFCEIHAVMMIQHHEPVMCLQGRAEFDANQEHTPVCPNCGQYQYATAMGLDCVNDCARRGLTGGQ